MKMSKMCVWVVAQLPQRLKSTFFEKFSSLPSKKFQKTLILAFEANSALSLENETKIVKITHSAHDELMTYSISGVECSDGSGHPKSAKNLT